MEKKFSLEFRSYPTRAREIPKKIAKKIQKMKTHCSGIISTQTGVDRQRKREKKFRPEFRSYPTRVRNFQKNNKKLKHIIPELFLSKPR